MPTNGRPTSLDSSEDRRAFYRNLAASDSENVGSPSDKSTSLDQESKTDFSGLEELTVLLDELAPDIAERWYR